MGNGRVCAVSTICFCAARARITISQVITFVGVTRRRRGEDVAASYARNLPRGREWVCVYHHFDTGNNGLTWQSTEIIDKCRYFSKCRKSLSSNRRYELYKNYLFFYYDVCISAKKLTIELDHRQISILFFINCFYRHVLKTFFEKKRPIFRYL